jgi:hypothetical protein
LKKWRTEEEEMAQGVADQKKKAKENRGQFLKGG